MCCRAVSVNLNWRNPANTLANLVRNSGCRFLFASRCYSEVAKEIKASNSSLLKIIFIEDLEEQMLSSALGDGSGYGEGVELTAVSEADSSSLKCKLHDVCAVFFTSGSTSLPKAGWWMTVELFIGTETETGRKEGCWLHLFFSGV
jgi:long-subunit acyl-CoA synthetase (AMP-forming)